MIINVLGDSITAGACATDESHRFTNVLASYLNCQVNNYGVGGSRFAEQKNKVEFYDSLPFYVRAEEMDKSADLVLIFGGTNDYGHGDADFGKLTDTTVETYCGSLNYLCDYLLRYWKSNQIIFILPISRYNEHLSCPEGHRKDNPCLEEYRKAMIDIVSKHQIKTIDLRESYTAPSSSQPSEYYQDGLHPTNKGHELIANILNKYIRTNIIKK